MDGYKDGKNEEEEEDVVVYRKGAMLKMFLIQSRNGKVGSIRRLKEMATSDKENMEDEVKETEDDEEQEVSITENDTNNDDDEFIANQDIIHDNSDDDEVTSDNDGIIRSENVDIRTNSYGKRKAGSGHENPEEGKKQK